MPLQIKTTGRSEYGQFAKMLVYGEPGSRKTLFGSTAPKPFYLNIEGGLMTIAERHVPHVDILEVVDLQEVLLFLRNKSQHDYETVVIDTVDEMQRIFIADRLKKERREAMQLQDWGYVGEQMQKALRAYRNLPMHVILLCHAKTDSDSESGAMIMKPALQGAISEQIAGYVDLASHISVTPVREGEEVVEKVTLRFQSAPRFPHIKDRSGKMPGFYELNLQTDFQDILKVVYGGNDDMAETEVVGEIETMRDRVPAPDAVATTGPARAPGNPTNSPRSRAKAKPVEETSSTPFEPTPAKVKVVKMEEKSETVDPLQTVKEKLGGQIVEVVQFPNCSECGEAVTDQDVIDLSTIRYQTPLCKTHLKVKQQDSKSSR